MKTPAFPGFILLGTLSAQMLALSACGDSGTVDLIDKSGSIVVTVQTSAATAEAALDPDGYSVSAGPQNKPVASNGTVTFDDVSPGEHVVTLQELQANCTAPVNPAEAAVVAGGTAQVAFQVTCWPPTTGRIVFISSRAGDEEELFTMNADGTDLVQLTTRGNAFFPAWSPDGWRIAFTFAPTEQGDIYVINHDGSGLTQLTSHISSEQAPSWSPDGTRIAFARSTTKEGLEDIYVIDADDGGNEVQLTSDPARDFVPAWSPGGSKIAFTSERDGNLEIYLMNADGSDPVNLTNHLANDVVWPGSWSPDGTRILFGSGREGTGEIFVMNADGSDPVMLTDTPFGELYAGWSPDGTKVVFYQQPANDIFVMNADGTGMINISNSGGLIHDKWPHWSWGAGAVSSGALRAPAPGPTGSR
jgi:Tol biopolymer transport system component